MRMKSIIVGVGLLCLLLGQRAKADLYYYDDGGVHIHNLSDMTDTIYVDKSPPPPPAFTTVIFSGRGDTLKAFNNSQVTMNGALLGLLSAYDNSQVTMNAGHAEGISALDNSQVTMNDGVTVNMAAGGNSQVTINGGHNIGPLGFVADENSRVTITGGYIDQRFYAGDNSQAMMTGGYLRHGLGAGGNSEVMVSGGHIVMGLWAGGDSRVTISGGDIDWPGLDVSGSSQVAVVGSDFVVWDQHHTSIMFSGYGTLTSPYDDCLLWGTLASGELLAGLELGISGDAQVSLVPVPVPGAALLGTLGLSFAGWRLRRRTC
jgi:hypothetical protein